MNKKLLLSLILWVLGALGAAFAQETLTVFDGTGTSSYVPVYGLYCDSYQKCEFVIPSATLEDMTGASITNLTWYLSTTASASWGNANFKIFMKELDVTSLTSYSGIEDAVVVYEGPLDGTQSEMNVELSTTYEYEGGNLLIGIYQTSIGSWKSAAFFGTGVDGASISGYSGSSLDGVGVNQRNFIPKTTFTYTPGSGVTYHRPTQLAISNLNPNGGVLTWTPGGNETAWNVGYKIEGNDEWTEVAVTEPTYTLEGLTVGKNYQARVQADYGEGHLSGWSNSIAFTTPICNEEDQGEIMYTLTDSYGDGWNGNAIQVVHPESGIIVATLTITTGNTASGTVKLCYDETYNFVWVKGSYANECSFIITDPNGETILEKAPNDLSNVADGTVLVSYTMGETLITVPVVTVDAFAHSASVEWTGGQESYNLRYRKASTPNGFYQNFEQGIPATWTMIDADGDGKVWNAFTASNINDANGNPVVFGRTCATSASYDSSGGLRPDNWLVTPQVELKGTLSAWLRGQDPGYPAEHFAIYVSTTGNTIEDFDTENPLVAETTATGIYTEYTADLSAFEGAMGYIAVRHFNTYNEFRLNLDNFTIRLGEDIPAGEWITVENVTSPYTIEGLSPLTDYEVEVQYNDENAEPVWTEPVRFTTDDAHSGTLNTIITAGWNGGTFIVENNPVMVGKTEDNECVYVADEYGAWACIKGLDAELFDKTKALVGIVGDMSRIEVAPTLTLGETQPETVDAEPVEIVDMMTLENLPLPCQVVTMTGLYNGEKMLADEDDTMGILLDTSHCSNAMTEGQVYNITAAIELIEPWQAEMPLAPRRISPYDDNAITNLKAVVLSATPNGPTGIENISAGNKAEVRYYDLGGRYVGKSVDKAPAGVYIGSDGSKVIK